MLSVTTNITIKCEASDTNQAELIGHLLKGACESALKRFGISYTAVNGEFTFTEAAPKAKRRIRESYTPKNGKINGNPTVKEFRDWLNTSNYLTELAKNRSDTDWHPETLVERAIKACDEAIPNFLTMPLREFRKTFPLEKLRTEVNGVGHKHGNYLYKALDAFIEEHKPTKVGTDISA